MRGSVAGPDWPPGLSLSAGVARTLRAIARLRGRRTAWAPDEDSPGIVKRTYSLGRLMVTISKRGSGRGGGPVVLTSFDKDARPRMSKKEEPL